MAERYCVVLHAKAIDEAKPGAEPDTDITVTWRDLHQEGFVTLEAMLIQLLADANKLAQGAIDSRGKSNTPRQ